MANKLTLGYLILRDENGTAILDNFKQRFIFTLSFLIIIAFMALSLFTLFFIPYWIITGKNIFKQLLDN